MVKCRICKKNYPWYHYFYAGDDSVSFPTCKKCYAKAKVKPRQKTEEDIYYSDELALFRIKKLDKRLRVLERQMGIN